MKFINVKICSDSMSPLIKVNDFAKMQVISKELSFKRFDILVFRQQEKLMAHFFWRTQKINNSELILTRSLKAPTVNDYPIEKADLVGIIRDKKLTFYHKTYVYLRNIISGSF